MRQLRAQMPDRTNGGWLRLRLRFRGVLGDLLSNLGEVCALRPISRIAPTAISRPDTIRASLGPRLATNRPETVENTPSIAAPTEHPAPRPDVSSRPRRSQSA
jgi:hypothetical protein